MREWLVRDRPSTRSTRRPDIESGRPRCRGCELGQPKKVGCQPRVTSAVSAYLPLVNPLASTSEWLQSM